MSKAQKTTKWAKSLHKDVCLLRQEKFQFSHAKFDIK